MSDDPEDWARARHRRRPPETGPVKDWNVQLQGTTPIDWGATPDDPDDPGPVPPDDPGPVPPLSGVRVDLLNRARAAAAGAGCERGEPEDHVLRDLRVLRDLVATVLTFGIEYGRDQADHLPTGDLMRDPGYREDLPGTCAKLLEVVLPVLDPGGTS